MKEIGHTAKDTEKEYRYLQQGSEHLWNSIWEQDYLFELMFDIPESFIQYKCMSLSNILPMVYDSSKPKKLIAPKNADKRYLHEVEPLQFFDLCILFIENIVLLLLLPDQYLIYYSLYML